VGVLAAAAAAASVPMLKKVSMTPPALSLASGRGSSVHGSVANMGGHGLSSPQLSEKQLEAEGLWSGRESFLGWDKPSRLASRPLTTVTGSEVGAAVGSGLGGEGNLGSNPLLNKLETAAISASSLRKALALAGAWSGGDGKALGLPLPLPLPMRRALERIKKRHSPQPPPAAAGDHRGGGGGGGATDASSSSPGASSSRGGGASLPASRLASPAAVGVGRGSRRKEREGRERESAERREGGAHSSSRFGGGSGVGGYAPPPSGPAAADRASAEHQHNRAPGAPYNSDGGRGALPSLAGGGEWFADEATALASLRAVTPMVEEWRFRSQEDGYPIPTLVEELVEKNALAASMSHGWWTFVAELLLLAVPVPRWRTLLARQLQEARTRLDAQDYSSAAWPFRMGGMLVNDITDEDEVASPESSSRGAAVGQQDRRGSPTSPFSSFIGDGASDDDDDDDESLKKTPHPLWQDPLRLHRLRHRHRRRSHNKNNEEEEEEEDEDGTLEEDEDSALEEDSNNKNESRGVSTHSKSNSKSAATEKDCACGTCSFCVGAFERNIPVRLEVEGNNSVSPQRRAKRNAADAKEALSAGAAGCALRLASAAAGIREKFPIWSDDQVRELILKEALGGEEGGGGGGHNDNSDPRGDPELVAFHRDHAKAFEAFTDRLAVPEHSPGNG